MNRIERYVHARVGDYPWLRIPVVAVYQRLMALLPREEIVADMPLRKREGSFFGFHDKCPWSADGTIILGHAFDPYDTPRQAEAKPLQIGVLESESLRFHGLAETRTWNWQQGAMLQWVGSDHTFLYNDADGDRCVARLVTVDGASLGDVPLHVTSVSPNGQLGLGYSFARMKKSAPEYAYSCGADPRVHEALPTDDGISRVDLRTGQIDVLLTLAQVANQFADPTMCGAYHYFTHTQFSPSGHRFAFMHRWVGRLGVLHTRLMTAAVDGGILHQFPVTHASHFCWRDDQSLFVYCRPFGQSIGYYLLADQFQSGVFFGEHLPSSDGHPQFSSDGRYLVTDTYPDRGRIQSLVMHDTVRKISRTLMAVKIGFEYRYSRRCDFHPRWSRDATQVCFDSAHTGVRSLCVMDVSLDDPWR